MTYNKSQNSSSNEVMVLQKYMDKITKMQQDQEKARQEEYALLREHLDQMNKLINELINVSATGSTVAATKKIIPFHTGKQSVGQLVIPPSEDTPPPNPDDYPTQINIYAQNDNKPIQHMTLINDGPGQIFFVVGYSETDVNRKEGQLNVNDQRELFNVYQIRLRSTLPETTFRLIEGIFRTGSFAPQTKANVEIRPTVQANESIIDFGLIFDNSVPITVNVPNSSTFPVLFIFPGSQPPLPPGQTASFVNHLTNQQMPFTIPEGVILETFSIFVNMSTDFTVRDYFELIPGSSIFVLSHVFPVTNRGAPVNLQLNLNELSTQFIDPTGAPPGGRQVIVTITNDDPFNNMVGVVDARFVLRRLT